MPAEMNESAFIRLARQNLYKFHTQRTVYDLSSSTTGFFQTWTDLTDVHRHYKTIVISPLIGVLGLISGMIQVASGILLMAGGVLALSPTVFFSGAQGIFLGLEEAIITPLVAATVTFSSIISIATKFFALMFSQDWGAWDDNYFCGMLPDEIARSTPQTRPHKIAFRELAIQTLYDFPRQRKIYDLSSSTTGFFQTWTDLTDVHRHYKTIVISPLIGVLGLISGMTQVASGILRMAGGVLALSPTVFFAGAKIFFIGLERAIITPLVAAIVTFASIYSISTKFLGLMCSLDWGPWDDDYFCGMLPPRATRLLTPPLISQNTEGDNSYPNASAPPWTPPNSRTI